MEVGSHWWSSSTHSQAVLPPNVMLEVEYEGLVHDFESHARRIVSYCGLEWDPVCLEFNKTSGRYTLPAWYQVRQPIYRSSVGRWHPDSALLRPLTEALAAK